MADLNIPELNGGSDALHAAVPAHTLPARPMASTPSPADSNAVVALDEILSGWRKTDVRLLDGVARQASTHVPNGSVRTMAAAQAASWGRRAKVLDPTTADSTLDSGVITRSLLADSITPLRKRPFLSSLI